jgi:hypothetical protein
MSSNLLGIFVMAPLLGAPVSDSIGVRRENKRNELFEASSALD